MKKKSESLLVILLSTLLWLPGTVVAESSGSLQDKVSALAAAEKAQIGDVRIYGNGFMAKLYAANGYQQVWVPARETQLRAAIDSLAADGLRPADYWFPVLDKPADLHPIERDILLSEAFIRAYYNLLVGKVDPEVLDSNFNFAKPIDTAALLPQIIRFVRDGSVMDAFAHARVDDRRHQWLREALARYRGIAEAGGWPAVAAGPTLKPGMRDPRVAQVRERLRITGDYDGNAAEADLFDDALEAAVSAFQERHGIDTDGMIGAGTLAAMNVPVEGRINQLRVNLERQRWYLHEHHGEYIVADIAGFNVYWVRDDAVYWSTKAQVGTSYTQTPMFKDLIRYIEFNPTWTIPAGIKRRTILPNLKKDPNYLDKKGYLLLSNEGKPVDPGTVEWSSMNNIPYIVRQPPGPDNALGLVKFMFPNKHAVYLHDTNHRENFAKSSRSFSSGCIRVDQPFDLAEKLLARQEGWDRARIDAVIASGKTTRVNLDEPMRIVIAYSTARATQEGRVFFKQDIYERDQRVLNALDGHFNVRKRES